METTYFIEDMGGFFAIIMSLSIPILIIIGIWKVKMYRAKFDLELRKSLIENHVDAETSKIIIEKSQTQKSTNIFNTLRIALTLIFMGLTTFIYMQVADPHADGAKESVFLMLVLGAGIGLFLAILIQRSIEKKQSNAALKDESADDK